MNPLPFPPEVSPVVTDRKFRQATKVATAAIELAESFALLLKTVRKRPELVRAEPPHKLLTQPQH